MLFDDSAAKAVDDTFELALDFAAEKRMRERNFLAYLACREGLTLTRNFVNELRGTHFVECDLRFGQGKGHFCILAQFAFCQRSLNLAKEFFGGVAGDAECFQGELLYVPRVASPDVKIIRFTGTPVAIR